ncbi:MAG: hypothetical protein SCARUB_01351 [Candidatus Scalindua rubra]|uniref:Uncharacterized protein n=1 Tax=Candidatus Scalindua rubra TaxID=1872076 RepID=A0A1E3XD13_9BACT|nr:MAG: hypothetical protein SCARUB_01351 [Candidatus Scalindua rubra]
MVMYGHNKLGWSYSLRMGFQSATKGNYEDSVKFYKEALKEEPKKAIIYNNLADAYMNLGQLDQAVRFAKEAIARPQEQTLSYVTLAEVYRDMGEHKQAIDCILKALEIYEEAVPQLKDMLFGPIDEIMKKLPPHLKLEVASCNWIRTMYLVKYIRHTYEMEKSYVDKGVAWEVLLDFKKKSLSSIGSKYLAAKKNLGIKGSDTAAIAKTCAAVSSITGKQRIKIIEEDESRALIQIFACWECSVIKSMELDKSDGWISCSHMCQEHINTVAKAINPRANFVFTSTLADGDKYCEGTVEIKSS